MLSHDEGLGVMAEGGSLELVPHGWYDAKCLSKRLGLSFRTIDGARRRGNLRSIQLGHVRLFKGEWVHAWLELEAEIQEKGKKMRM